MAFSEHPSIEEWYDNTRKYDNVYAHDAFDNTAMLSPDYQNAIPKELARHKAVFNKYEGKGLRTYLSLPTGDATIPLASIEFAVKQLQETFKME